MCKAECGEVSTYHSAITDTLSPYREMEKWSVTSRSAAHARFAHLPEMYPGTDVCWASASAASATAARLSAHPVCPCSPLLKVLLRPEDEEAWTSVNWDLVMCDDMWLTERIWVVDV